ncbi:MAG: metallophosphoesterase family protein [Planctomycetota bacterium]
MRAIVSDIHGNLAALLAVLADATQQGATEVLCLGDVVGYGPEPAECLDLAMTFATCLLGNFDAAVLYAHPESWTTVPATEREGLVASERTAEWTYQALRASPAFPPPSFALLDTSSLSDERPIDVRRRHFLAQLPRQQQLAGALLVHASPRSTIHEYLYPEDSAQEQKMAGLWPLVDHWCFIGHTHVAGIFLESGGFRAAAEFPGRFVPDSGKAIINPGSVGLPRDGDARASYVLWDGEGIEFRRVPYDVQGTLARMLQIPEVVDAQVEQWLARSDVAT